MKIHSLEVLIEQGEHQQQDFKFEVSDSKKIARTLSAFANTDGGRLLIGVKDNGHISGIRSDEEYYMIEAASQIYTMPHVPFTAKHWDVNGKCVLEIDIEPGTERPYLAPDKEGEYKAYVRVDDENILANGVITLAWQKMRSPEGCLLKLTQPVDSLFDYLECHPCISIGQFCRVAHIRTSVARQILSDLIAMEILEYVWQGKSFHYRAGRTFDTTLENARRSSMAAE